VTEEITGVDLVEWQLRVASGEPLPLRQEDLSINGHAIEARLYAEDPARGFLPSIGTIERWHMPEDYVRIDTGFEQGSAVTPFYDPMLAKVIVHADTRENALALIADRMEGLAVWPVRSNAAFLYRAVSHPRFRAGDLSTEFIERHQEDLIPPGVPSSTVLATAAKHLVDEAAASPTISGFRLNAPARRTVRLLVGETGMDVAVPADWPSATYSSSAAPGVALVTEQGQTFAIGVDHDRGGLESGLADGIILAPMPGKVIAVDVAEGEVVTKGQRLLVLEAMKMEHALTAPFDGTLVELKASEGQQVQVETLLAKVEKAAE